MPFQFRHLPSTAILQPQWVICRLLLPCSLVLAKSLLRRFTNAFGRVGDTLGCRRNSLTSALGTSTDALTDTLPDSAYALAEALADSTNYASDGIGHSPDRVAESVGDAT